MPETPATEADAEELPLLERNTLRNLYRDFSYTFRSYANPATRKIGFIRFVNNQLSAHGYSVRAPLRTEIAACARCSFYDFSSTMSGIGGREVVCTDCVQWYARCSHCSNMAATSAFYPTATTTYNVCLNCLNSRLFYCSDCATYQPNSRSRSHRHLADQCCDSQVKQFQVPNNGDGMLTSDTRAHIQLPAGQISDEGVEAIRRQVRDQQYYATDGSAQHAWSQLSQVVAERLGNQWQTKDGNYPKRLSRFAYKEYGLKVPPELMTTVGNVARDHSGAVDHYIEVTRELNLPASEFVHAGSCWWTSYSNSRCAFKTNGGFGMRTYRESGGRPQGRAWVLPLKRQGTHGLTPTYNAENPIAYMVFNGYGDLQGYTPARILSYMMGTTYKKMSFTHNRMYINAGGYLVASQEVIQDYVDNVGGTLELSSSVHATLFDTETRERELTNA